MQAEGVVPGIGTLQQRASIAIYASYAVIGVFALALVCEVLELAGVIDPFGDPDSAVLMVYAAIMLSTTLAFVVSIILVAMWIHRAHANLHEAGLPGLQTSPGWAVGWYFVPIANLFKPFQAMRELWHESHQTADSFTSDAPGTLTLWWGLWVIGNILANVSFRLGTLGDGSNLQPILILDIGSSVCVIGAAWQLVQIITAITAAQRDTLAASAIFE
ncbi:DUF4328 domain-containing protein [Porphyrobacter sp. YT40]|uniref:DUF4328 domain-containing protein n=1 Tax=Porphyrobacter sp. YT40 TaxID=2547601 RepID=UPI001143023A|nr:DUF4328 domain-containing protein [Porphyrobacter sp. YT40]QDH34397.1 DUF4328 domain-containing protein [Porphyrobacter sp. YT40]